MTALPIAKRDALRFRIWQYAEPREWNVTIAEIAEALEEPTLRVRSVIVQAKWNDRVRSSSLTGGHWRSDAVRVIGGSLVEDARPIVRDVLAGRVGPESPAC